ncbi:hypothetical protein E5352_03890 [Stenotrophomonas maltophilia]|uniref:Uncharacterized protein n=1 Tax=Stenotrophomonas maltophilia TaxID=40324 RepID=A0A4S2D2M5_STEMA|nr:hypothetical protein E5352_03890 [Stenotrophomonas maltophilia]
MNISLTSKFASEVLTASETYDRAAAVIQRLASAHPEFLKWWSMLSKPTDKRIAFDDRVRMTALIQRNRDAFKLEYPSAPISLSGGVLLTNVTSEAEWLARGSISLSINPGPGEVQLEINRIEQVFPSPTELVWASLRALAHDSRVNFVNTNVQQGWGKERKLYSLHCGAFPHREFLGWMGYVSRRLTADQIPEAARMEHAGEGTLIMATENLDLFDASAVEQVNRVEIRLAELGLLPVTDSRLL